MSIPKTIHYCWFGGKEKPELVSKCIESWKKFCPDFEIIEWNEKNFDVHINKYADQAYSNGRWAFVADYARCYVVNKWGGVYFDTDVELIKPIDDLLNHDAFFASEDNIHINTGIGFGSDKNNKILNFIIDDYNNLSFFDEYGKPDLTPCPMRNTRVIKKIYPDIDFSSTVLIDGTLFLDKEYFCPLDYTTRKMNITNKTYGIHWFNGSWMSRKEKIERLAKDFVKGIIKGHYE